MVFASIPDDYHLSLISGFCNYIIRKNNGMQVMVCKGPPLHKAHNCGMIWYANMVCKGPPLHNVCF